MERSPMPAALQRLMAGLAAGLVMAVIEIFVEVSFATLMFTGDLKEFAGLAIGLCLAGSCIYTLFAVAMSSSRSAIAVVQETPLVAITAILAALTPAMGAATAEQQLATALAVIACFSSLAGLCFWLLGRFQLGQLLRFIPYPVVGGFLAGTGMLLVTGGISVMVDAALSWQLLLPGSLIHWLPGVVYGLGLLLLLSRFQQFWMMPLLLLVGCGLFYGLYGLTQGGLATAAAEGWLVGPFPAGRLWYPTLGLALTQADWPLVLAGAPRIAAGLLVSSIALLCNISGLEVSNHEDIDINRELQWSGLANLAGALAVSPSGFTSLSFTSLGNLLGGRSRLVGLSMSAIIGVTLWFGTQMLAGFPRPVAGGLLVFIGLSFLVEWVYDTWFKLSRFDYLLIWVIMVTIVAVGFLAGVALGSAIAALLFLISYSRTNIVRHSQTRADYVSATVRSPLYEQLLTQRGQQLWLLTLQGYLFFGTAHRLGANLKTRLADDSLPPLRFLILDFRLVTGMDSSARLGFERLLQQTAAADVRVIVTDLPPTLERQLGPTLAEAANCHQLPTLAAGISWAEEQMLARFREVGLAAAPQTVLDRLAEQLNTAAPTDWLDFLNPVDIPQAAPELDQLMGYLERREFKAGDQLLASQQPVDGLYLLEAGSARYASDSPGSLEAGTVLALEAFYSQQPAPHTITAAADGVLYYLSRQALETLETHHPRLAIVLHRILLAQLSWRTQRATRAANARQP